MEGFFLFSLTDNHFHSVISIKKSELKNAALEVRQQIVNRGIEELRANYKNSFLRITVMNNEGDVLYDNFKDGQEKDIGSHRYREEVKESINGKEGFSIRESTTIGKKLVYYTLPMQNNIIVRTSDELINATSGTFNFAVYCIVLLIILDLLLLFLYRNAINFYKGRLMAIKEILENNKVCEIYMEDDQDLKYFWNFIKGWQKQNFRNLSKLEEESEKLKEIISSIDIGIIVIKETGKIKLFNDEAKKNFIEEIEDDDYHAKIRNMEMIKFINKLQKSHEHVKEDMYIPSIKKYFIIEGKYLEDRELFIIMAKDITKDREINELQKRFITNVSHELKTPLTNVKGYLIALETETDEETKKKFLDIVGKNVFKIEKMVIDFLDTTKIENSRILNAYPVSIDKFFDDLFEELKALINTRKVKIEKDVKLLGNYNYIKIDYEKMLIVLKNLVENSILYNDKDIPKISIGVKEYEDEYVFLVEDNGMGISEEEIPKVFERFYRVNKARSGNAIGTGLGLSIVKEIVKIHKGNIHMESNMGIGTKVTIIIKK